MPCREVHGTASSYWLRLGGVETARIRARVLAVCRPPFLLPPSAGGTAAAFWDPDGVSRLSLGPLTCSNCQSQQTSLSGAVWNNAAHIDGWACRTDSTAIRACHRLACAVRTYSCDSRACQESITDGFRDGQWLWPPPSLLIGNAVSGLSADQYKHSARLDCLHLHVLVRSRGCRTSCQTDWSCVCVMT